MSMCRRIHNFYWGQGRRRTKLKDLALKGEASDETNLDTIDSASCRAVHSELLLE